MHNSRDRDSGTRGLTSSNLSDQKEGGMELREPLHRMLQGIVLGDMGSSENLDMEK